MHKNTVTGGMIALALFSTALYGEDYDGSALNSALLDNQHLPQAHSASFTENEIDYTAMKMLAGGSFAEKVAESPGDMEVIRNFSPKRDSDEDSSQHDNGGTSPRSIDSNVSEHVMKALGSVRPRPAQKENQFVHRSFSVMNHAGLYDDDDDDLEKRQKLYAFLKGVGVGCCPGTTIAAVVFGLTLLSHTLILYLTFEYDGPVPGQG